MVWSSLFFVGANLDKSWLSMVKGTIYSLNPSPTAAAQKDPKHKKKEAFHKTRFYDPPATARSFSGNRQRIISFGIYKIQEVD